MLDTSLSHRWETPVIDQAHDSSALSSFEGCTLEQNHRKIGLPSQAESLKMDLTYRQRWLSGWSTRLSVSGRFATTPTSTRCPPRTTRRRSARSAAASTSSASRSPRRWRSCRRRRSLKRAAFEQRTSGAKCLVWKQGALERTLQLGLPFL